MNAKREYINKKKTYESRLEKLTSRNNIYGNVRLIIVLIGIIYSIISFSNKNYIAMLNSLVITAILFVILVMLHQQIRNQKNTINALYNINDKGIKRLKGEWVKFDEQGEEFIDVNHNYSSDLDIFGKHSLFQWLNQTNTPIGKEKLKKALIDPVKNSKTIINRQQAVKELASKIEWMQQFLASGMLENKKIKQEKNLINWSKDNNTSYCNNKIWSFVRYLPIFSIATILLAIYIPTFSYVYSIILFGIQIIILFKGFAKRHIMIEEISEYRQQITVYEQMIKQIEDSEFESQYLMNLKNQMIYNNKETASMQIKKLDRIMDMVSLRRMQFYILFNIITLWDIHCVISLEKWKEKYGDKLPKWIDSLGDMEALCSIATIAYEQPNWVMPTIVKDKKISASNMGHPLIHEDNRVCNDVTFGGRYTSLLITGSNMSGKSTFLRTIGINLVLAYAGAPVCADNLVCPMMDIYTSMRISDDIENKISSFYAELLRIKKIIEATKQGKDVLFLLDEIFRGTNSKDRHVGAKTLIRNLCKEDTLGLISTHDLELADMALEENSKIKNYHFQEHYKENKIYFDYTLYKGVSNTFNAIYLMKQIGIEM
ncbi:MAG: DNA mismatch repair protein [Vallitalea sp.]|jgi:DNA mismatch repair ATPase MutS|nr:DNA mismatch repair protein [Vallitalea sp.]